MKTSCFYSILILFCFAGVLVACQVPVFRYALERWPADSYRFIVVNRGPLSDADSKILNLLSKTVDSEAPGLGQRGVVSNVEVLDAETLQNPLLQKMWMAHDQTSPLMIAVYPQSSGTAHGMAHSAPLTEQNVQKVLDSPVRREVAKRLQAGQSAVWILIESGNDKQDMQAFQTLEKQLLADQEMLELPSAEELEIEPTLLEAAKIKLKIEFSIVRLNRNDPQEQFLLESLLNSESDLKEFDAPIAFPVFGRGRALYALVGKGIQSETIRTASSFMVGPCSCQVKAQNPGFDLLMSEDWEAALGETLISEAIPDGLLRGQEPQLLTIPPGRNRD